MLLELPPIPPPIIGDGPPDAGTPYGPGVVDPNAFGAVPYGLCDGAGAPVPNGLVLLWAEAAGAPVPNGLELLYSPCVEGGGGGGAELGGGAGAPLKSLCRESIEGLWPPLL